VKAVEAGTSQLHEMRKNTTHSKSFSFKNKIVVA
jgi:hypothetical protein